MKAVIFRTFQETPGLQDVPDPNPTPTGVVIAVKATGICLSDWHGWMGHDPDIKLPHVPGHELAGEIVAVGKQVQHWRKGDRVTLPFVGGCGHCGQCLSGNHQVCDTQFQPGFTHWGSFAEYVAIDYADTNLVALPTTIDFTTAASLGCRFATAFRALIAQGQTTAGQWVAIHGCGGVGLSAIMIAHAIGARVIAIDIKQNALELASSFGAQHCINANTETNIADTVRELSNGGVDVSIDAIGSLQTCYDSVTNLRKRGKHIQVGLMTEDAGDARIPMAQVIANELEILGSHGMQAYRYHDMLAMIEQGRLQPEKLVSQHVNLQQSIDVLTNMHQTTDSGITVINSF